VKAVVKHEVAVQVDIVKEKAKTKIEHVVGRITGEVDDGSNVVRDVPINDVMDKELVFLDSVMSESDKESLDKHYSKTKEASASQYAHLHDMVTPLWRRAGLKNGRPLNETELFFQKGIDYAINDPHTPGMITEWEARWISILYQTKKADVIKRKALETKEQLMQRFRQ